jgi:hypothetical protein
MRSLNATVPKVRQYVRWSKIPVQWSHDDHPEHIPDGYYAMVVNPLIQSYEFSKCLMDGGSSLNIMYVETPTKLGLTKIQLRHSAHFLWSGSWLPSKVSRVHHPQGRLRRRK